MLPVAEAQARVLAQLQPLPTEWVALAPGAGPRARRRSSGQARPATGRGLGHGRLCRARRRYRPRRAAASAGRRGGGRRAIDRQAIGPGEAVRIFTGGALPPGADAIVIQENAERDGRRRALHRPRSPGHVRAPGRARLPARLDRARRRHPARRPRRLASPPSLGHVWLPVRRRPRIGLLATGNELRWPGETPQGSQICSSNTVIARRHARSLGRASRSISASAPTTARRWPRASRDAARARPAGHHRWRLGRRLRPGPAGARPRRACGSTSGRSPCGPASRCCSAASATCRCWAFPAIPSRPASARIVFLRAALQSMLGPARRGCAHRQAGLANPLAAQRPAPGLSARTLCRAAGPTSRRDRRPAGQLDARHVRRWPTRWWCARPSIRRARRGDTVTIDRSARSAGQPAVEMHSVRLSPPGPRRRGSIPAGTELDRDGN